MSASGTETAAAPMIGQLDERLDLVDWLPEGLRKRWERRLYEEVGLTPTSRSRPQDVFLVGYPKSGSTWLQSVVAALAYGCDLASTPDALVQELVPDVHVKRYYRRFATPTYFKCHRLPSERYRKVVYLLRDGRDVLVSYFHHKKALGHDVDLEAMVTGEADLFPSEWHDHVERWQSNPHDAEMLTVRYEDMLEDLTGEMERLCEFLEIDPQSRDLPKISEDASFEGMKKRIEKYGWAKWPGQGDFLRRGVSGSFEDELPSDLKQRYVERVEETLARFGYSV